MDELEVLLQFRSDVDGPDDRAVARARIALLERIEEHSGAKVAAESSRRSARAPAMRATGQAPAPGRSHRRWTAAAAVAAMAAAVLVPVLLPGGRGAQKASASAFLSRMAAVAARQRAAGGAESGQFWYTKSDDHWESDVAQAAPGGGDASSAPAPGIYYSFQLPSTREIWLSKAGTGRLLTSTGDLVFLTEQDRQAWIDAGRPDLGQNRTGDEELPGPASFPFASKALSWDQLMALPTDQDALDAQMRAAAEQNDNPTNAEMFTMVGDLLRESPAPPALRAALYRVAAAIPGVELLGNVQDPEGRPGVAVGMKNGGYAENEYVIDPHTGALLAERSVLTESWHGLPVGTVTSWAAYLRSGFVESDHSRP